MEVWKIIFLSKWLICRFHVDLPGCSDSEILEFQLSLPKNTAVNKLVKNVIFRPENGNKSHVKLDLPYRDPRKI